MNLREQNAKDEDTANQATFARLVAAKGAGR
jgi:hypothetical protein